MRTAQSAPSLLPRSDLDRQPREVAVAFVFCHAREQIAADELITLADLVSQHALFFQQRQPPLGPCGLSPLNLWAALRTTPVSPGQT
jgi:hypothetical protein